MRRLNIRVDSVPTKEINTLRKERDPCAKKREIPSVNFILLDRPHQQYLAQHSPVSLSMTLFFFVYTKRRSTLLLLCGRFHRFICNHHPIDSVPNSDGQSHKNISCPNQASRYLRWLTTRIILPFSSLKKKIEFIASNQLRIPSGTDPCPPIII